MTDYDRGEFVRNRTITIDPCANGTFMVVRGLAGNMLINETMGFSSAADMLKFLNSEYEISTFAMRAGQATQAGDKPHDH